MVREKVLMEFATWDTERQIAELQGYRNSDSVEFSDEDFHIMEVIINNKNLELIVACDNGICEIVNTEKYHESITHQDVDILSEDHSNFHDNSSTDNVELEEINEIANVDKAFNLDEIKGIQLIFDTIFARVGKSHNDSTSETDTRYIYSSLGTLKKRKSDQLGDDLLFHKIPPSDDVNIKSIITMFAQEKEELELKLQKAESNQSSPKDVALITKLQNELNNFDEKKDFELVGMIEKMKKNVDISPENKRSEFLKHLYNNDYALEKVNFALKDLPEPSRNNIITGIKSGWEILKQLEENNPDLKNLSMQLFNLKFTGEGKGERLIEFLYPDAKVSGGSLSYDIELNSQKYEVKAYPPNTDIKLGKEARATNFNKLQDLQSIINALSVIFSNETNVRILDAQIGGLQDSENEVVRLKNSLLNPVPGSKNTLSDAFSTGEISKTSIDVMKDALKNFSEIVDKIKNNSFYYMKIFNKNDNTIYKVETGPTEIKGGEVGFTAKPLANPESEQFVVNTLLSIIDNTVFMADPAQYLVNTFKEIEDHINDLFEKHPMILLNDSNTKNDKSGNTTTQLNRITEMDEVLTKFKVVTITRGHAAVLPV
jgi:hypothetical protein